MMRSTLPGDDKYKQKILKAVNKIDHFKVLPPSQLTIPGDAPKFVMIDPHCGRTYIAKTAKKHGVQEVLTEYLINCIGMSVPGLNISRSRLGSYFDPKTGIRTLYFLSLFFHTKKERLTHGIQLFQKFYSEGELESLEKARKIRDVYTLENIISAIDLMYPDKKEEIVRDLLAMCLFDALVGNRDRHASNWGIIEPVVTEASVRVHFSPIYDSARGLFWNMSDDWIRNRLSRNLLDKYIEDSTPQISTIKRPRANHLELVGEIVKNFPTFRPYLKGLFTSMARTDVKSILAARLFREGFSPLRKHAIVLCINQRLARLEQIL